MTNPDPNNPQFGPPAGGPAAPPPPGYGGGQPGGFPPPPPAAYGTPPGGAGMYHDQASGLNLPHGVTLAPVGRRIGAYFLSILLVIVTLVIGYIIWGLILWGKGTTPALKVLGMKCWRPDTQEVPGFGRMALREIVGRIVDGILSFITEIVSFVMFVTGAKHQSLHDIVAGTVVVYDPNKVLDRA